MSRKLGRVEARPSVSSGPTGWMLGDGLISYPRNEKMITQTYTAKPLTDQRRRPGNEHKRRDNQTYNDVGLSKNIVFRTQENYTDWDRKIGRGS